MERYKKARIYKIVGGGYTYYGSTCLSLSRRLSAHKSLYKRWLNGKTSSYVSVFEIFNTGNYDIYLVEEYMCDNKEQLRSREGWYIENNECINKIVPSRTFSEADKDIGSESTTRKVIINRYGVFKGEDRDILKNIRDLCIKKVMESRKHMNK